MLGMIFNWLEEYAKEKAGANAWKALHDAAGVPKRQYFATAVYSEESFLALVTAASEALKQPIPALVEDFGVFLVPKLRKIYGHLIRPEWGIFELLDNVNDGIHGVVCSVAKDAKPPTIQTEQVDPKTMEFVYNSKRGLCWLVKGLLKGFATSFQQNVQIEHPRCLHSGGKECRFRLRL